MALLEKIN